jgi:hypothetical protein
MLIARTRVAVLIAATHLVVIGAARGSTAAVPIEEAVAAARRELEIAKIHYRAYRLVEAPRVRRELDAAIRLTDLEVDALEERVRHYRKIDEFRNHRPLLESLQKAEIALAAAELRLKALRDERQAWRRTAADRCRLCELEVAAARARVIELERVRLPQ